MEDNTKKRLSGKDYRRLYSDLAWMWPIVSPAEDYVEETEFLAKLIKENSKIEVETLLHLGCGGGHNDYTFKKHFKVTGVDIRENMLKLARKLNSEVTYYHGDMCDMKLRGCFDAVTILDSINYLRTVEDIYRAFATAHQHLRPGGVFLTFMEQITGLSEHSKTRCSTHSKGNVEITFIENYYDPDPDDTSCEATFVYLVRRGGELEIHTDRHLCGIFKLETWIGLLEEIGFIVKRTKFRLPTFEEYECFPILICIKP